MVKRMSYGKVCACVSEEVHGTSEQTDRQTDRQTDKQTGVSLVSIIPGTENLATVSTVMASFSQREFHFASRTRSCDFVLDPVIRHST